MQIVITLTGNGAGPVGKVADAEIQFTDGLLNGLKLLGFTVWSGHPKDPLYVRFPSRQYVINGERRSFSLLRVTDQGGPGVGAGLERAILDAYAVATSESEADIGGAQT